MNVWMLVGVIWAAAIGIYIGHVAYDVTKLYRRKLRRERKLAQEVGGYSSGDRTVSELPNPPASISVSGDFDNG